MKKYSLSTIYHLPSTVYPKMPVLEAINLHKKYTSTRQGTILPAIQDVSFSLAPGEFLCIVGPSGCGKTTLLRLLAGLIQPDQGEVRLHGEPLRQPSDKIGLVFQKANLMPWRTVADNILLPLQVRHQSLEGAARRVEEALAMVGLADFARSYPRELSGGMQQRVSIARALVYQPEILLLDEPFGALDALTRETLNVQLMELWEASRKTVVMVTHNIREAIFLADRVLVLSQRPGRVVDSITVNFPRPRRLSLLYNSDFAELAYRLRQAIQ